MRWATGRSGWAVLTVAAAVWYAVMFELAPAVIAAAHRGESLELLNAAMRQLGERPLRVYLGFWRGFAGALTVAVGCFVLVRHPLTADRARRLLCGRPGLSMRATLGWALWFGTLAGLAEALHLTLWYAIERHPSRMFDWEFVWMAPPASALGFLVIGALLALAISRVPAPSRERSGPALPVLVFVFTFLLVYGVLGAPRLRLATPAALVLCLGLAALASRHARSRPERLERMVRRSRWAVAGVVTALVAVGVGQLPSIRERRAVAGLPDAPAGAPDVILVILDTVRSKSLSLYGHDEPTSPNLARWAERGVVFERGFSTAPWTLPAHASLFTGRWAHEHGADFGVALDGTHETLAERFSALGYRTAGFTANRPNTAATTGLTRGFARYEDYVIGWGPFLQTSFASRTLVGLIPVDKSGWRMGGKSAAQNTDDVLRWLSSPSDRPFFLFVNYFDAHETYPSPPRFRRRFPSDIPPVWGRRATETEAAGTRALYHAAIAYVDEELDRLLREIEGCGILENAVLIISSDHGEAMGEHGLMFHGNHVYPPILHVPLVAIAPGRIPGRLRVEAPASLRDVGATLLELATGDADGFPGRSLVPLWSGEPAAPADTRAGRAEAQAGLGPLAAELGPSHRTEWKEGRLRSIVSDGHQYIRNPDGSEELYDLVRDPATTRDLVGHPDAAGRLETLRARLDSVLAAPAGDARRRGG